MRPFHFLRTPIRGDHQSDVTGVRVTEAPLRGDPPPDAVYPQTLEISFETVLGVTEVQIAPLWEGLLRFLPESTAGHPIDPADVTRANYPGWPVTGDLILSTLAGTPGFDDAFRDLIPLICHAPTTVRYSAVSLTEDFLFTTLAEAPPHALAFGGELVDATDPLFHAKLVICFLAGTAGIPCLQDPDDSGRDTALKPMPAVVLDPSGERSLLRVAVASVSEQARDPAWFDQRPAYDDIPGELLVDPALQTEQDARFNPSHPSHSVIPAWGLFQAAALAAYAPDHDVGLQVRAALTAPRPDGLTYRRIDLRRPRIGGVAIGSSPQRPYPQYRLCWRREVGAPTESLRIPLSGQAYLPLADGPCTLFALPRSVEPDLMLPDDRLSFSVMPPAPAKAIDHPQTMVTIDVTGVQSTRLYGHLRSYDALHAWEGYEGMAARRGPLMAQAEAQWNAEVLIWYLLPTTRPESAGYAPLYGLIRESAGRHGLAPEFLQTVLLGEGVNRRVEDLINGHQAFDPDEVLDAFNDVGLDLILYRTGGRQSNGDPWPLPPQLPEANVEERAEYEFNLVAEGYVDAATAAAVSRSGQITNIEGPTRTIQIANIAGWAAAVELMAAELHARLDEMVDHLAAKTPPVPVTEEQELERRYLAYVRFNATPQRARVHADALSTRLRPWPGARPSDRSDAGYNTIQRIAVTQWHEAAGVYR